ncbi:hypothetical protein M0P98_03830 [bacterium]|nr:hypothetical protein [bacterium]
MKILKFVCVLSAMFMTGAYSQENINKDWQERKDSFSRDKSIVRHYTFEGVKDSSSVVKDVSGNGLDLVFMPYIKDKEKIDDLQVIEGRWPGKPAVRLDMGWYQGAPADINNNQFTVEVWFRRNGPASLKHTFTGSKERADGGILSTANGMTKGWRLVTVYNQRQSLEFFMGNSEYAKGSRAQSLLSVPDGVWHHLATTWDGEEVKLYLNGIPAGTLKYKGPYAPAGKNDFFKIGYLRAGVGSVVLDVDEVIIYNRALSPQEIEKLGKGQTLNVEKLFQTADNFIKKGNYKLARAEYEKIKNISSIDYGLPLALFNIAESYRLEKDYANAHKTYKEISGIPNLPNYYKIYGLFNEAEVYTEQKNYGMARQLYSQILKTEGTLGEHQFKARLKTGDTYRGEKKYSVAKGIYEQLLREEEVSSQPHNVHRLELRNRLEAIDGLADGANERPNDDQVMLARVTSPKKKIYVSPKGRDTNPGTKDKPFASIKRAQQEVRKIKVGDKPQGGIKVYLRGGNYFTDEGFLFEKEDSGEEDWPVVYSAYPGEEVRLIGGKQVKNFKLLTDTNLLKKLPTESKGKVWVADLKTAGVTKYGEFLNRGGHDPHAVARKGALEVISNGKIMTLARWPNTGYARIAGLPNPKGDGIRRREPYQEGKFLYSEDRPERWTDEKEIWVTGFLAKTYPYQRIHVKILKLDTEKKMIETAPDIRWGENYELYNTPYQKNGPYFVYNLFSEIDSPGEWYLDRDSNMLYFWPPEDINKSEVIVTTADNPVVSFKNVSYFNLVGVTVEGSWTHGIEIEKGTNNLIAGCVIRNTGQYAVNIKGGWNHSVFGCDMYDMGEGGAMFDGGDQKKLIPARHKLINNHIHRFNRFCGGYRPASHPLGIGHIISHNLIHDTPMQAVFISAGTSSSNEHIIEFNEFHDAPYEAREFGNIYINGLQWRFMNRGNVIRNNFFHHISYHSSPNTSQGLNAIHIDSINGGFTVIDNVFYKVPSGISNSQPDSRLENNLFIEPVRAISQGNRVEIYNDLKAGKPKLGITQTLAKLLNRVNYKQPPWNYRYPQLTNVLSGDELIGYPKGNVIERNINTGGPFISVATGIRKDNLIQNNWEEGDPIFFDKENMDFRLRVGSPAYGSTGSHPIPFEEVGVYKHTLRASWPVDRTKEDIGKYYNPDFSKIGEVAKTLVSQKRVSKVLNYTVQKRVAPIEIDGKLNPKEWLGLDKSKAMVIEQYYTGEEKKGPKSYAWMLYDDKYLYIATTHDADPYKEGMPITSKKHIPFFEVDIESQHGQHSSDWWIDDMPTGPVYIFWGDFEGKAQYKNSFGMSYKRREEIEKSVVYKSAVLNQETQEWVAEMRIPFSSIGLVPADVKQLAFNIGVYRRDEKWFTWVATGTNLWRVENAGLIRFEK